MVGDSTHSKGYEIWEVESKSIIFSSDIQFDEFTNHTQEAVSKILDNYVIMLLVEGVGSEMVRIDEFTLVH